MTRLRPNRYSKPSRARSSAGERPLHTRVQALPAFPSSPWFSRDLRGFHRLSRFFTVGLFRLSLGGILA